MTPALFELNQKVTLKAEENGKPKEIIKMTWTSEGGYLYALSSKYFDAKLNEMVEGEEIHREDELVAYEGEES